MCRQCHPRWCRKTLLLFFWQITYKKNIKKHVVSRGYGRKFKDSVLVDQTTHSAYEVGDEPLLISKYAKVGSQKKRKKEF